MDMNEELDKIMATKPEVEAKIKKANKQVKKHAKYIAKPDKLTDLFNNVKLKFKQSDLTDFTSKNTEKAKKDLSKLSGGQLPEALDFTKKTSELKESANKALSVDTKEATSRKLQNIIKDINSDEFIQKQTKNILGEEAYKKGMMFGLLTSLKNLFGGFAKKYKEEHPEYGSGEGIANQITSSLGITSGWIGTETGELSFGPDAVKSLGENALGYLTYKAAGWLADDDTEEPFTPTTEEEKQDILSEIFGVAKGISLTDSLRGDRARTRKMLFGSDIGKDIKAKIHSGELKGPNLQVLTKVKNQETAEYYMDIVVELDDLMQLYKQLNPDNKKLSNAAKAFIEGRLNNKVTYDAENFDSLIDWAKYENQLGSKGSAKLEKRFRAFLQFAEEQGHLDFDNGGGIEFVDETTGQKMTNPYQCVDVFREYTCKIFPELKGQSTGSVKCARELWHNYDKPELALEKEYYERIPRDSVKGGLPGDVVIFQGTTYGHVAIVINDDHPEKGTITVLDQDGTAKTAATMGVRPRTEYSRNSLLGFLRPRKEKLR